MRTVYLDECVDQTIVAFLSRRGIQAVTAQEQGMTAVSDDNQIRFAHAKQWLILSTNERHFFGWHRVFQREGWPHSGIIIIRQTAIPIRLRVRCAMMLDWIDAEFPDPRNTLFRWTDLQQQLIGGYRLANYSADEIAMALGRQAV